MDGRIAALTFLLAASVGFAAEPLEIVPRPKKIRRDEGTWTWAPAEGISVSKAARPWIRPLLEALEARWGRAPGIGPLGPAASRGRGAARIGLYGDAPCLRELGPSKPRAESYVLVIDREGIRLAGADGRGILYGVGTLVQLLPGEARAEGAAAAPLPLPRLRIEDRPAVPWRGIHVNPPSEKGIGTFEAFVDRVLVPLRINVLVMEVNYRLRYGSHPEVRASDARPRAFYVRLARFLRSRGIRPIPQFNCLGHQSWAKTTLPLLVKHPEFDETPWLAKDNPGIYCRSWCPRHPGIHAFVCDLLGELTDAFGADALHVGMDEVFILGDAKCPRCAKVPKDELFAGAVNDLHACLAKGKVETLMWGDRFLERSRFPYSKWDSSENGTAPAIDRVPKDLIICDWHYGKRDAYPSIPHFQRKGFRVLACSWRDPAAARAFYAYALAHQEGRLLGFLATTWMGADGLARAALEGGGGERTRGVVECIRIAGGLGWTGLEKAPR